MMGAGYTTGAQVSNPKVRDYDSGGVRWTSIALAAPLRHQIRERDRSMNSLVRHNSSRNLFSSARLSSTHLRLSLTNSIISSRDIAAFSLPKDVRAYLRAASGRHTRWRRLRSFRLRDGRPLDPDSG